MKRKHRLFWHLLPGYLLLAFCILLVIGWFACASLRQLAYDQKQESLEQQARLLQESFLKVLDASDTAAVDRLCKAIGRRTDTRVTAILPGGKVIGDSDENPALMDYHNKRPEVLEAMAGRVASAHRYSRTLMQQMMYVAVPLKTGGQVRAVLRTSAPMGGIEAILESMRLKLALFAILFVGAAAVICRFGVERIRRLIEAVRRGAEAFAADPSAQRLLPEGPAEVAALTEAVNRMAIGLGRRIDELVTQRNEYEAVWSSMVEGVVAIDFEGRLLGINHAAVDMLQIDPTRLKGMSIVEAVRNSAFQQFVADAQESGDAVHGDVVLHLDEERVINVQCVPLRDSGDARVGTLIMLTDVTQMRRLQNVRQEFVANASHEIKTPLTAIKGFVETLIGGALYEPKEAERFLGIISNHVNRLEVIIEDLLALARLEQTPGKSQLALEESGISGMVGAAVALVQSRADEKNILIEVVGQEGLRATVDASLFEQAIVNLIDNAVKYSPRDSTVSVQSGIAESGEVFIRVTDQGPGIAKKYHAHLFERFYRVDKARSRDLGGTGLGLAIVKHILNAHGGRVSLESAPGQGSAFTLYLPPPGVVSCR